MGQVAQIDQNAVLYSTTYGRGVNHRSLSGVAISATPGEPEGSDGRAPSFPVATAGQFRGFVAYGAVVRPRNPEGLSGGKNYEQNAANIDLPRGSDGATVTHVLRSSQVAASFFGRPESLQFGSVIAPPTEDEKGVTIAADDLEDYWLPEPYTLDEHLDAAYYWSPSAEAVYAIQAGPIQVTWQKATGSEVSTGGDEIEIGGVFYALKTETYVVSGAAAKTPRKIFWTEGVFRPTGQPVDVPSARVSSINVVYSSGFPERVAEEYLEPGQSVVATNGFQETRTLWFDNAQSKIRAYNLEGRVFVELLGESFGDERKHLGYEIVDVFKAPTPADIVVNLGERISPDGDSSAETSLVPIPLPSAVSAVPFLLDNTIPGTDETEYFAVRETQNLNDVLVYWLESGVESLMWPNVLARYQQVWPEDISAYSHYIRPLADTKEQAALSAVPQPSENGTSIQYQDPTDRSRAFMTETNSFYTWLEPAVPAHRTLLRMQVGNNIAFERVFSWLDENLQNDALEGSLAEELTSIRAYYDYQELVRTRGVNGEWKLYASDDRNNGMSGVISSWAVEVITGTGSDLTTRIFTQTDDVELPDAADATPYPSIVTVSGITEEVAAIRVQLNGITHNNPDDIDVHLVAPSGGVLTLTSDAGGSDDAEGVNLVFEDDAAFIPNQGPLESGTFRTFNRGVLAEEATVLGLGTLVGDTLDELLAFAVDSVDVVNWPDSDISPRLVSDTAIVGERLIAPDGELGATGDYLAGHVHLAQGNLFHPAAYIDPLVQGFEAANLGAIIPVNAIPGTNQLDVLWFRQSAEDEYRNEANGFLPTYWPSVLANYTITWPTDPSEIVLASNVGSGPLDSLQAAGSIYVQNDPEATGYNPNEEHAVLLGGIVYALRDDLNISREITPAILSGSDTTYSSEPYVLLDYEDEDGRPAIRAFRVLREKPSEGVLFDYVVEAGTLLQAPMPLPLLPAPTEGEGAALVNYNTESIDEPGDLPSGWSGDATNEFSSYAGFTFKDRNDGFWVTRALHSGSPVFEAGYYDTEKGSFTNDLPAATAVIGEPFELVFHASRLSETLSVALQEDSPDLPEGLLLAGTSLTGTPTGFAETNSWSFVITDTGAGLSITNELRLAVVASGTVEAQGALTITSYNQYSDAEATYVGRPPTLAAPADPTNSFTMRFYYLTEDGFAWPGVDDPPAVGRIVPYLRPVGSEENPGSKLTPSLEIVYRPTWPGDTPSMNFGQTLTEATAGLPAIRGQTSVQILYQQSIATNGTLSHDQSAVILQDPTREKVYELTTEGLDAVPDGVMTDPYQGRDYFPLLPPHLANRLYFDASRGADGALVFAGEFKDETLGEKYLLLNVLSEDELETLKNLCPTGDDRKAAWDAAIEELAAEVETFVEDPEVPGQFIADTDQTVLRSAVELVEVNDADTAVSSYALSAAGPGQGFVTIIVGNGSAFTPAEEPVSMYVIRVSGNLHPGELKVVASDNPLSELLTFQHTVDLAAEFEQYEYQWKIAPPVDGFPPEADANMTRYTALAQGTGIPNFILGGSGIEALSDNYLVLRYRPVNPDHPLYQQWSEWTEPALAEGWIKRVLAGINPFNQRVTDLYNNTVDTDGTILTEAGQRWEGDVALNLDSINDYGLIEIYETVLRRGRSMSIDAGINYGPANDALLFAAGYINDLYMLIGNEAYDDASNPTIGIGTDDRTFGDIATAQFAFKGQLSSLLEEELALLRGRDDVALPGVTVTPVYNRLVWNYTRGIDSGEVIYAMNYNIRDLDLNGATDAEDAAHLYPQGHGDAYGHYLTALKGYYALLMNTDFDWVPRVESVTILGQTVTVDYLDERKFAKAAAATARTGQQIFDLTWRKDYQPGQELGWERFADTRESTRTMVEGDAEEAIVRHWGADQWASRSAQGAFLNWVVGNAILPEVDTDPTHEGIQKVDRTTVPELKELATIGDQMQRALENAENRLTPLGLPEDAVTFDINPDQVSGSTPLSHFEQIYERTRIALQNAVASFDDAKEVTRQMRGEQISLADLNSDVAGQEIVYNHQLIELFGTPYPDDIGAGKLYPQDYAEADFYHHMYVDDVGLITPSNREGDSSTEYRIDLQVQSEAYLDTTGRWILKSDRLLKSSYDYNIMESAARFGFYRQALTNSAWLYEHPSDDFVTINLDSHGFFEKPASYTGRRSSPGKLQAAISRIILAHNATQGALEDNRRLQYLLDRSLQHFEGKVLYDEDRHDWDTEKAAFQTSFAAAMHGYKIYKAWTTAFTDKIAKATEATLRAIPDVTIAGLAVGGDIASPAKASIIAAAATAQHAAQSPGIVAKLALGALKIGREGYQRQREADWWGPIRRDFEHRGMVLELEKAFEDLRQSVFIINQRRQELQEAEEHYRTLLARGDRILAEREFFRQTSATSVQGFRTRDVGFRIFRNEKLERYKALFDLASHYTYLAAKAYDYETGLLNTDTGRDFLNRIIASRALGVVVDGEPQYAGSDTGDPGLSSILAEMKADWDVIKGRLGFVSPDSYGTLVSLRTENFRVLPSADGDDAWENILHAARVEHLLDDADIRRYCLQIDPGTGAAVPGLVLSFSTTITPGENLFGQPLAAGDSAFHRSAFATKLYAAGVALEGYKGMNNPAANGSILNYGNGEYPEDPSLTFLDSEALSATPYVYLIPVGADTMRSPPLGDEADLRTWNIADMAIPLPFNIGASDYSAINLYQAADSLSELPFTIRKHQAFRPVSSITAFTPDVYGVDGIIKPSQFTNRRLIGRSIWNSKWKLVIPGDALLADPDEGLDRLIDTLTDIKLYFLTYSYSGN